MGRDPNPITTSERTPTAQLRGRIHKNKMPFYRYVIRRVRNLVKWESPKTGELRVIKVHISPSGARNVGDVSPPIISAKAAKWKIARSETF